MLSHVAIENFRGFKSYKLDQLAQINLFVGKNNSGKTAILEGVQLLASQGDPGVLVEAAHRRGELVVTAQGMRPDVDIAHIFHGHTLSLDTSITLRGDNGYKPVIMNILARSESENPGKPRRSNPGYFFKIAGKGKEDRAEPKFPISGEGGVDFEVSPYHMRRINPIRRIGRIRRDEGHRVRFVGSESLATTDLAMMWDEIAVKGQEAEIADAMRVIDDQLESVQFLTGIFSSGYFPSRGGIVVGMKGRDGRVPLGSLGDGMRRVMALAASLASTKDGCLFVDEIDTGLHYSIMCDMWNLVVSKAVAGGSQVFATTHSWDCVDGLKSFLQRDPGLIAKVAIHKIDRNLSQSVAFAGESLDRLVKSDIDPR